MEQVFATAKDKMNKSVNALMEEYATIRVGRASASVLDKVMVDYYGAPTPVNQMAAVSVPEPRTLLITPWDKTTLKAIEKAIQTSDIGLNPQNDRHGAAAQLPAFDRGTPQGPGEKRGQIRGGGQGGRPFHPPRCHG